MTTKTRLARTAAAVVAVLGLALLAGCDPADTSADVTPTPTASATSAPTAAPAAVQCDDATTSYAPDAGTAIAPGSTMAAIRDRGSLVVGVSADTLLMGARNPLTGQIEGFDIDVLHEVSRALFGDPNRLQFRVITSGQRIDVLTGGQVDLVARTFTMNCDRWQQIAFSAEYLRSGQKLLVTRDSTATSLDDLAGRKVCAPKGTTTLDRLGQYPEVTAVPADTHTACLVLFQQGKVDAITGDDTVLAGFAAQDPYAKVVGDPISAEPYGIGVPAANVDMVRFVNAVLDQAKADGTWTALYDRWLGALGPAPVPPASVYGRTP
ncbi:glutamate ABC transporter substrate-binding protein [Cellulomonas sp.]|uniref:glutamate ABC transporter substrate-binding protein n=1 Tax=Cellulomonas sp. TaxID=40001 RepID=UPI001B22C022|nr:glutamate ABC transporter substrate-binding protein [Cellulomonas sp.]MBO9556582.1 glutamate ABC transporter substrate-binding protein [Cellulomonas sp.]